MSKSGKSKGKKSKKPSKRRNSPNFDITKAESSFLTPDTKIAFNRLWLAFTKTPILQHFDPKCHIQVETDVLGYAISGVLSQMTSETSTNGVVTKANLGQWQLVAFFSRKMIPAETWYKTHDSEFLAIVEAFKTWRHYLKDYKYKVIVFMVHNNLRCFMSTKSLSSRQVRWAQELSQCYFQIEYCQGKANAATEALLKFLHKSQNEEDKLQAKNGQIFHCLHDSLINANLASLSFFA